MIRTTGTEWELLQERLDVLKLKSNRDVLCVNCWAVYNYEQRLKHVRETPSHAEGILTSRAFASGAQMISIGNQHNKIVIKDGERFLQDPFQGTFRLKSSIRKGTRISFIARRYRGRGEDAGT